MICLTKSRYTFDVDQFQVFQKIFLFEADNENSESPLNLLAETERQCKKVPERLKPENL